MGATGADTGSADLGATGAGSLIFVELQATTKIDKSKRLIFLEDFTTRLPIFLKTKDKVFI